MKTFPRYWMIFMLLCIAVQTQFPSSPVLAQTISNDPTEVGKAIREVSADRRFVYPERNIKDPWQQPAWMKKLQDWMNGFLQWLKDLFGEAEVDSPRVAVPQTGPVDLSGLLYVLYGLAAVALIYLIYRLILHHYPKFSTLKEDGKSTEELIENLDPGGRMSLAQQLMKEDRWAEALSALMLSLLLVLDARGLVRYHRSRTSGEYLRGLRKYPVLYTVAREFVHNFEEMKFGHRVPDRDGTEYLFDLYGQTEKAIPASQPETKTE